MTLAPQRDSGARAGRTAALAIAAAVVVALALRLAFRIDYAEEIDSVRFLLALERFDVPTHRPHFPGYPVFVFLGRALLPFTGGDAISALAILCAVSGALLVVPVAFLARAAFGPRAGVWAGSLAAVSPIVWLHSAKLLSDVPGLLFLFAGLAVVIYGLGATEATPFAPVTPRPRVVDAGFLVLGLALGVRLSYFPFLLSATAIVWLRSRRWVAPLAAAAAGGFAWAVPLVVVTGWERLVTIGRIQGTGHFNQWGGSLVTVPALGARATALAWQVIAQGLGTWWSDRPALLVLPTAALAAIVALLPWRARRPSRSEVAFWSWLVLPYLLWAFLGQNVTLKARHALPLVVLALVLAAGAIDRALRSAGAVAAAAAAVWVIGLAASGLAAAREHAAAPSIPVRLAREIERRCVEHPGRPVVAYTASLQWHLPMYAPCVEPVVVRRLSEARRDLARRDPRTVAFVVSDVAWVERLGTEPLSRFQASRYVHSAGTELSLYGMGGVDG